MSEVLIAPSVLAADFGHLSRDVVRAERAGADWIHVDVMDGHFVPNLTIGQAVAHAVRDATALTMDVHLMIEAPERIIPAFVEAGADLITVHQEACPHLHRVAGQIRDAGVRVGVAINPATPVATLTDIVAMVDLVLVMTVNPGFGGQRFIPESLDRIRRVRALLRDSGREGDVQIQVDGGIDMQTAPDVVRAGARVLVAGSAVFGADGGPEEAISMIRHAGIGSLLDGE